MSEVHLSYSKDDEHILYHRNIRYFKKVIDIEIPSLS